LFFTYKNKVQKSSLVRLHDNDIIVAFNTFQVVVTQMNGSPATESIHVLHVGKMRIKLCKGKTTIAKEYYSSSMQVFKTVDTIYI